jgi:hypothetical protein
MTQAFVCGNGVSRQAVDLNKLRMQGKIYGCNAMYREFEPDCLVATDRPIAEVIQQSGYSGQHRFHTRRPLPNLGAQPVPKPYHGYSSGPIAISLAALDGHAHVYLLGFDLGPTSNSRFNNVYAGTDFYKSSDSAPTYTGNWIKQIVTITKDFPQTTFVRVCGPTTADIKEFKNSHNLQHVSVAEFLASVTTGHDL